LQQDGNGGNKGKNAFGRVGVNYDFNDKNSIEAGVNYSRITAEIIVTSSMKLRSPGCGIGKLPSPEQWQGQWRQCQFQPGLPPEICRKRSSAEFQFELLAGWVGRGVLLLKESTVDSLIRNQQNLRRQQPPFTFPQRRLYLADHTQSDTRSGCTLAHELERQCTNAFYNLEPETNSYVFDDNISNIFGYKDATYTGFMTFSQKTDLWGLRAGLRVTDYNQNIDQVSRNQDFSVHFLTLVPSLAVTRKLGESSQVKLNYSRRVQRPEADWLNPYTDVSDPRNVRTGNPNLRPEFTHKAEMGYSNYEANGGWGPSLFMDYSNNAITQIRTIDEAGVSLTRYDNVGREFSYGFETDFSQKLFGDILKLNGSGRVFRSEVVSAIAQIDNRTWSYSGNLNAFITLPADFRASAYVNYEGPRAIAQGTREGVFIANMGIRKDLLEKKATISFNVQDIFLSRAYKSQLNTATYSQNSLWQQTNRLVNLTFQYRFGKITASGDDA
jgi:outer membrane receptor protein involved in Fe transport